ncbi:IS66 family insertion sequence element accessory protein TnpB [Gluconacetobacter entanii]|nr:IS66 family insertion sequence element accessory protein TnpB [Gluconacetobacter entanii]
MIPRPSTLRIWLAAGVTDMRLGVPELALKVQKALGRDPFAGDV